MRVDADCVMRSEVPGLVFSRGPVLPYSVRTVGIVSVLYYAIQSFVLNVSEKSLKSNGRN